MSLLQTDVDKIQTFYYALQAECNKHGIPLRQAGTKEERHPQTQEVYLVSFFFQVMMSQYELFVNTNVNDENRYGWRVM